MCKLDLIKHPNRSSKNYSDSGCPNDVDDHSYAQRVNGDVITQIKVRFTEDDGSKMYFKVYYDSNRSEIWTKSNDSERIRIDQIITVNFDDIPKLKQKIKSYFLFS